MKINRFRNGFLFVLCLLLLWCLLFSGGCAMLTKPSGSSDGEFRSHIITRPPKSITYYSQPRYGYWNERNYYQYHHKKGR